MLGILWLDLTLMAIALVGMMFIPSKQVSNPARAHERRSKMTLQYVRNNHIYDTSCLDYNKSAY